MKIGAVFIALSLLSIPLFATGATVNKFQGGNILAVADLSNPNHSAVVNITIPAECVVLNATMNVTGAAAHGIYPMAPEVSLDDTILWAFNGTGYGALGKQNLFSDGTTQLRVPFGVGGGTDSTAIRLPKGALVQNATLEVNVSGPIKMRELMNFPATDACDYHYYSVSNAGDVNNDGNEEVIVGTFNDGSGGANAGRIYLYSPLIGIQSSNITAGSNTVWNKTGYFNGTDITDVFSDALKGYIRSAAPSGNDGYGNSYVDVPISISAESEGNITLFNLIVEYQYNATIPDFANLLNNTILAHRDEGDANGNITMPIIVCSQSAGQVELYGLNITYDGAPVLAGPIPDLAMDEDTVDNSLLDLYRYFKDDYDPASALKFGIENATNSSIVNISILVNRSLSTDALTGEANDNWTGVVSLRIRCTDSHGFSMVSESFDIVIQNVNDPPIITSTPPINATAGIAYVYQITAVDGDHDALTFRLPPKPENMTISEGGRITWIPPRSGTYDVSVAVGDGQATAYQNFSIHVTVNNPPRFTTKPVANATVGVPYTYNASAIDDDNDTLNFSIVNRPEGMTIDPATGRIAWTPTTLQIGNQTIIVNVTDGKGGYAEQSFVIRVEGPVIPPARPKCAITSPADGTTIRAKITLQGTATKGEVNIMSVHVRADGGTWLVAINTDNWTYKVDTTKLKNGPHKFDARAFDGANYSDLASVTLVVDNPHPYVSGGNKLWWILPVAVLLVLAAAGLLFWRSQRRMKPEP